MSEDKQEKKEVLQVEEPKSNNEEVVTIKSDKKSELKEIFDSIEYREWDSNDVMRIRSHSLVMKLVKNDKGELEEKLSTDLGEMQKLYIICGIKSAPFFSHNINENVGLTSTIFKKRYEEEFRKIPAKILDAVYEKVQEVNKVEDQSKLQKN